MRREEKSKGKAKMKNRPNLVMKMNAVDQLVDTAQ